MVRLSVYPSVGLSFCPSVIQSACHSVRLSICPSVRLSNCQTVRLSVCPSVPLSLYLPSCPDQGSHCLNLLKHFCSFSFFDTFTLRYSCSNNTKREDQTYITTQFSFVHSAYRFKKKNIKFLFRIFPHPLYISKSVEFLLNTYIFF